MFPEFPLPWFLTVCPPGWLPWFLNVPQPWLLMCWSSWLAPLCSSRLLSNGFLCVGPNGWRPSFPRRSPALVSCVLVLMTACPPLGSSKFYGLVESWSAWLAHTVPAGSPSLASSCVRPLAGPLGSSTFLSLGYSCVGPPGCPPSFCFVVRTLPHVRRRGDGSVAGVIAVSDCSYTRWFLSRICGLNP